MQTQDSETRGPVALKIAFFVVAFTISGVLIWQMDVYTRRPGRGTLDRMAKLIKPKIKRGDAIAFTPSWMSGYAMGRKGYKGKLTPKDIVSINDPKGRARVWVLHTHVTTQSLPGIEGYEEISIDSIGDAHMQLMRRLPTQNKTP